ncbi:site-specific integrase [Butyricimonas sp. Marseille-P3923]|uniref:tyrosine-type recombinase/integrase n=1 Tax=Butyricimonas sp. Marseille-P3923 TaxID=1987504 RepID=UPI000C078763|nr:site-specific integrase [Butyricimonas sp. Marseille-P3923]
MASIKIRFRESTVEGKMGSCFIQIIHRRKIGVLATGIKLHAWEWDKASNDIRWTGGEPRRQVIVQAARERLRLVVNELRDIIGWWEVNKEEYTVRMIVNEYNRRLTKGTLFSFMGGCIEELKGVGRERTSGTYCSTLKSFKDFRQGQDIRLNEISASLVKQFENYLKSKGVCLNTISFYMRILRAVYNKAVGNGLIREDHFPFRKVFTGVERTVKRAITRETVSRLLELDLRRKPNLDFARDLFLFSMFTRGMAFVDVAHLLKTDIVGDEIVYKRKKTGQRIRVKLLPYVLDIIHKHRIADENIPFLFPLCYCPWTRKELSYASALRKYNKALEELSKILELEKPLSSYVARHTWATQAKRKGVALAVISEAMGHTSENTTRIYLASFNEDVVDKANETVVLDFFT